MLPVSYAMKASEQPYATLTLRKGQHPTVRYRYGVGSASSVERLDWTIRGSNPCQRKRWYLGSTLPPTSRCRRCIRGLQRSGYEVGHLPSSGVEISNNYSCTSPPIRLRGVDCDNFAVSFEPRLWSQSRAESGGDRKIFFLKVYNQRSVIVARCWISA